MLEEAINTSDKESLPESDSSLTALERIIDKVNGAGRYQFWSFVIFNYMWLVTGWLLLGEAFFFDSSFECDAGVPSELCRELVCAAPPDSRASFLLSHAPSITFAFEPFLICEWSYVVTVLQSMIFVGSLVGFFLISHLADNWGRRPAVRLAWAICSMGVLIIALADSPNMIGLGYFLAGLGSNPAITLSYSFINEQCLGTTRQRYGVAIQIFLAIGESTIGLFFLGSLSWRTIFWIICALVLLGNFLLLYLLETPKFLMNRSLPKTLRVLNTMATRNGRPPIRVQDLDRAAYSMHKILNNT